MKNRMVFTITIIIIIWLISGCGNYNKIISEVAHNKNSVCKISVEPKMELLSVVQYMAKDKSINFKETTYTDAVNKYFTEFNNDPSINSYIKLYVASGYKPYPIADVLSSDNNFKLIKDTNTIKKLIFDTNTVENFLNELREFRNKSQFNKFYANQKEFYKDITSSTMGRIEKGQHIDNLIEYYGFKLNSYNLIIQPLLLSGYSNYKESPKEGLDAYAFIPFSNDIVHFTNLMVHEFSHSYIDPITSKYMEDIGGISNLRNKIGGNIKILGYNSLEGCINEYLVKAVSLRFQYRMYGNSVYQNYLNYEKENGFEYIETICNLLKDYENNRSKYKTFADFYPKVIETFKVLSNS